MKRIGLATGIVPAAILLASCQSDPNYATGPVPAPAAYPATFNTPNTTVYSKTRSSTWTSPDGSRSVTKSRSASASVSIDSNAILNELVGLGAPAVPPGSPAMGYFGKWQLTDGDNFRNCSIDLKSDQSFGSYRAWTAGCFTTDLFQVGKWQLRGNEIVLLDFSGKPQASLYATGPNRFDGRVIASNQPISMWR